MSDRALNTPLKCSHSNLILLQKQPPEVFSKKLFLKSSQNSQEKTCVKVSILIKLQASACNFIKKETLAQVHSLKLCDTFKNTYFTEDLWATASTVFEWKSS